MTETTFEDAPSALTQDPLLPAYMTEVYDWAYINPAHVRRLDRNFVVTTLLFGNARRLMRAYIEAIVPGSRVWQVAHVYGDLVARVAERVGPQGHFDLTDVTPIQVELAQAKLAAHPWARVFRHDAANWTGDAPYDLVCSFFLLHEVPDAKKRAIVDCILCQLAENGRAVFVDYHRPAQWNPVGWLLRGINAWLEPFAKALWDHDLASFASQPHRFTWHKRTLFGGVYQIVTVEHAKNASGLKT